MIPSYRDHAANERTFLAWIRTGLTIMALMIVALGNIGDPEPRPSLALLGEDANYPAAPPALKDTLFTR